jgi:hypothetical protein
MYALRSSHVLAALRQVMWHQLRHRRAVEYFKIYLEHLVHFLGHSRPRRTVVYCKSVLFYSNEETSSLAG